MERSRTLLWGAICKREVLHRDFFYLTAVEKIFFHGCKIKWCGMRVGFIHILRVADRMVSKSQHESGVKFGLQLPYINILFASICNSYNYNITLLYACRH